MKPFYSTRRKAPPDVAFLVLRGNDDKEGVSDFVGQSWLVNGDWWVETGVSRALETQCRIRTWPNFHTKRKLVTPASGMSALTRT